MSENVDLILQKARMLSRQEKVELWDRLVEVLADGNSDLSPEWAAEIERRLDALDRGEIQVADIREVPYKQPA